MNGVIFLMIGKLKPKLIRKMPLLFSMISLTCPLGVGLFGRIARFAGPKKNEKMRLSVVVIVKTYEHELLSVRLLMMVEDEQMCSIEKKNIHQLKVK